MDSMLHIRSVSDVVLLGLQHTKVDFTSDLFQTRSDYIHCVVLVAHQRSGLPINFEGGVRRPGLKSRHSYDSTWHLPQSVCMNTINMECTFCSHCRPSGSCQYGHARTAKFSSFDSHVSSCHWICVFVPDDVTEYCRCHWFSGPTQLHCMSCFCEPTTDVIGTVNAQMLFLNTADVIGLWPYATSLHVLVW